MLCSTAYDGDRVRNGEGYVRPEGEASALDDLTSMLEEEDVDRDLMCGMKRRHCSA